MRLFHVSEEPNIDIFEPREPTRDDLDKSVKLVWALNERCLPNYLTPRDCPRVTYHVAKNSSQEDIDKFFSSKLRHLVAIEKTWYEAIAKMTLYIYEFDPTNFYLQDEQAGYYVSKKSEKPISVIEINDLFGALFERGVEVRILDNLWDLGDAVQRSSLYWSLCRMGNAKARGIS